MPKNNSWKRKDERKVDAQIRNTTASYRDCGHWHTDNGAVRCGVVVLRNK